MVSERVFFVLPSLKRENYLISRKVLASAYPKEVNCFLRIMESGLELLKAISPSSRKTVKGPPTANFSAGSSNRMPLRCSMQNGVGFCLPSLAKWILTTVSRSLLVNCKIKAEELLKAPEMTAKEAGEM